jgi:uncharacterized membrane-anchored protein
MALDYALAKGGAPMGNGSLRRFLGVAIVAFGTAAAIPAADARWVEFISEDATPEERAFFEELDKLKWVDGPSTVKLDGNASLKLPEGFVYLDRQSTNRYLELNENLADGSEVMVAPADLSWAAYLSYLGEGHVKDNEEIDADALLQSLQDATEAANEGRQKRGWGTMRVTGWAIPPNYNQATQRLEWAASHASEDGSGVNFFTKILGRRGHTSVQLVASTEGLTAAESALNTVLTGFEFNPGDRYADFKPGDKVAEYGLAALVVGGAAALATKKGFWAAAAAFFAGAWKFIVAIAIGAAAWLRSLFKKKEPAGSQ